MDIIEVKDLTKKFDKLTAVDGISFSVKQGEIFAFLGPNGAGKTTTIRMLTTMCRPTSGRALVAGFDPVKQTDQVRRSFGIVFQDPSLDDELTALENLDLHGVLYGLPFALRRSRAEELLKMVDLWDRRHDFVKKYSGGMKRRLEIARGLMHHPRIFFLDEPTLGLDPQTRNHIWNYIRALVKKEGITVFLTTHYMDEADRVANRVAVIDHGRIRALDTPGALKRRTRKKTLEDAFMALTGHDIRDEEGSALDRIRAARRRRHA